VNVKVGPFTVDFFSRAAGLVVEADGYAAHRGRQAFEDDRARELYLHARGLRLRRFSDRQIEHHARDVASAIRAELRL
jgi:very-short-patch-repair endonuclease